MASFLLFMDESGHDHRQMPLEVRGGVAIPLHRLWSFYQEWQRLEARCFGAALAEFGTEPKGSKLLDKKRFKFAASAPALAAKDCAALARGFLEAGRIGRNPTRLEFAGYGQSSLRFADGVFMLLKTFDATIFATTIPRGMNKELNPMKDTHLRKDHAFLLERYYYFLNALDGQGLLVMDETDRTDDLRFVRRVTKYFTSTQKGRQRAIRILPTPLFVSSDMSVGVQAADIVLYCINWGFRKARGLEGVPVRDEIRSRYERQISDLQWIGDVATLESRTVSVKGIVHIPDPFTYRAPR